METYRVIGPHRVADTDPGGTVELDPERVNIPALIESGHIKPAKKATPARSPAGGEAA